MLDDAVFVFFARYNIYVIDDASYVSQRNFNYTNN